MPVTVQLVFVAFFLGTASAKQHFPPNPHDGYHPPRPATHKPETCSGIDISKMPDFSLEDLDEKYFSYYFLDTANAPSNRPLEPTASVIVAKGSNKFFTTIEGNNPNGGGCLEWTVSAFQINKNRPCIAEKGFSPESCTDEEWLYDIFEPGKLFFYFCAELNAYGSCGRKLLRGLSTKSQLSEADKEAFRKQFKKFGEDLPSLDDPANNDKYVQKADECSKVARATAKLEEAGRRLGRHGKRDYTTW